MGNGHASGAPTHELSKVVEIGISRKAELNGLPWVITI